MPSSYTIVLTDDQAAGLAYKNANRPGGPLSTDTAYLQHEARKLADGWAIGADKAADSVRVLKLKAAPQELRDQVDAIQLSTPIIVHP